MNIILEFPNSKKTYKDYIKEYNLLEPTPEQQEKLNGILELIVVNEFIPAKNIFHPDSYSKLNKNV
jgi:hypothetical protein